MDQIFEIALPIIVAIIASIPGILSFIRMRKRDQIEEAVIEGTVEKTDAEVAETLIGGAMTLVVPLTERITILEKEYNDLKRSYRQLQEDQGKVLNRLDKVERNNYLLCEGVRRLIHQIRSLGAEPVFIIDDDICSEMNNGK